MARPRSIATRPRYSGTIQGSGRDQRSSSATRGVIRYRLLPQGEAATKVELNVGYRLTGPLAQFSRSDLVHDIASRLIAAFAQNVEARLSGTGRGRSGRRAQCWQSVFLGACRPHQDVYCAACLAADPAESDIYCYGDIR